MTNVSIVMGAGQRSLPSVMPGARIAMAIASDLWRIPGNSRHCTAIMQPMNNTDDSDESLVGRHAVGDGTAFELLYRRHELRTWRFLERYVGNRATAEELLQEVWFAVARDAVRLQATVGFSPWLFTTAHLRVMDSMRAGGPPAAADREQGTPFALAQLSREQCEALLLQIEGELSVENIAAITRSTNEATLGHLSQARAKLQGLLPTQSPTESVDDRYRRASAADNSRPSEWVRRKVLAHAAQLAAERSIKVSAAARATANAAAHAPNGAPARAVPREAAKPTSRQPLILGALAVVVVAGVGVVWHSLTSTPPPTALEPARVASPETATSPLTAQAKSPSSDANEPPPASEAASSAASESGTQTPDSQSNGPASATPGMVAAASTSPTSSATNAASPPASASAARLPAAAVPAAQVPASTPLASRQSPTRIVAANSAAAPHTSAPIESRLARRAPNAAQQPGHSPVASAESAVPSAPPANSIAPAVQTAAATRTEAQIIPTSLTTATAATPPPVASIAAPASTMPTATAAPTPSVRPDGLWHAAESGNAQDLQEALDGHVDVNARNKDGRTALILATRHGHANIVIELLAHGADPNVPDAHGTRPLTAATAAGNPLIIVALKHAGAR